MFCSDIKYLTSLNSQTHFTMFKTSYLGMENVVKVCSQQKKEHLHLCNVPLREWLSECFPSSGVAFINSILHANLIMKILSHFTSTTCFYLFSSSTHTSNKPQVYKTQKTMPAMAVWLLFNFVVAAIVVQLLKQRTYIFTCVFSYMVHMHHACTINRTLILCKSSQYFYHQAIALPLVFSFYFYLY